MNIWDDEIERSRFKRHLLRFFDDFSEKQVDIKIYDWDEGLMRATWGSPPFAMPENILTNSEIIDLDTNEPVAKAISVNLEDGMIETPLLVDGSIVACPRGTEVAMACRIGRFTVRLKDGSALPVFTNRQVTKMCIEYAFGKSL